jgi:DNA topoisomerase-2
MTTKVKSERSVKDYENLTDREHALQRAGMYMGNTAQQDLSRMIFNPQSKRYEQRTMSLSEGFETIFDEILVNSIDQQNKDPKMTEIRVSLYSDHIVIKNNGSGLPLDEQKEVRSTKELVWLPTMLFGRFRSSENFNSERQGAGLNGIGAKIVNCYCREFTVETQHTKSRKFFSQTWRNNMEQEGKPIRRGITADDEKGGFVKITMWPDFGKFEMKSIDADTMALLRSRVYDAAGFLRNNISVYLNDQLVPVQSFEEYANLFLGPETPRATFALKDPNQKGLTRLELAIAHSPDGFKCHGLINGLRTPDGSHVRAIVNDKLGKAIVENLARRREYKDMKFQPAQFKDQIFLLVKMTVDNPEFNSQRKTEFTSKPSSWGFDLEFTQAFIKRLESDELGIVPAMIALKDFKENRALAALVKPTNQKKRIFDIPKLHDAENIGNPKHRKTLVITEGDSAMGLAKAGVATLEDNGDYGFYPLRGKFLNVREAKRDKIVGNELIKTLMRILGLEWGKRYDSETQLRYQRILIFTDADADGSHICGLVLNLVHALWPSVLEACPDYCYLMISPNGKLEKSAEPVYFFTEIAIRNWRKNQSDAALKRNPIKWLKGLASSEPEDAIYYFQHIDTLAVPLRFTGPESAEIIDLVFNSDRAEDRKNWINTVYDPESFLPLGEDIEFISWPDFFNRQFIHFSVYDNARSIPSLMDGLKPSHRKVLYTMLSQNIVHDRRVDALMGAVLERAAYHHGDNALTESIVGMAQNFIGTNNINLLQPNGIFGTREMPRTGASSDHGAARYIYSCLDPIARSIFCAADDPLLKYIHDDGRTIEPTHYEPIIPMLVVNGTKGIGTGWSSDVPKYNPLDIVARVQANLSNWEEFIARFESEHFAGEEHTLPSLDEPLPETLTPFYADFKGTIERIEPQVFVLTGCFERTNDTITITELPPEIYTENWKEAIKRKYLVGASAAEGGKKTAAAKKTGRVKAAGKKAGRAPKGAGKRAAPETDEDGAEQDNEPAAKRTKGAKEEFIKDIIVKVAGQNLINVVLKCDAVKLAAFDNDDLVKMLGLSKIVRFSNVWCFDINQKLRKFWSPEELIDYFCYFRYSLYERRKSLMMDELRYDSVELANKRRYLEMVMGVGGQKPYNVGGKSVEKVTAELEALGFDKLTLRPKYRDPENTEEEKASYWYLGKMLQWATTQEKINKLRRECDEALAKLEQLERTSPIELWQRDLVNFEQAYDKFIQARETVAQKKKGVRAAAAKKASGKKTADGTGAPAKKRAAKPKTVAPKRLKTIVVPGKAK